MSLARPKHLARTLLALILIAGSFLAGYLLMARPTPAPPASAALAATHPQTAPATRLGLIIQKALYGDLPDGASADVTEKVATLVAHESLSVAASNDNFGDPAENNVKKLRIDYTLDGTPHSQTVAENETLKIVVRSGPQRLIIKKALYGDLPNGASADVTAKLAEAADSGAFSIAATNDNFGDPAVNIDKKLTVTYTFDGAERSKTVAEGETLTISPTGE